MTTDARHHKLTPSNGGIHVAHAYEYANAAARTGATGLTADDVGKDARQTDNDTFWRLTDHSPVTWVQLGGAGGAGTVISFLTWGDDNITTTTTTRYLTPGFDDGTAETTETAYRVPSAGTAQNMRVRARAVGSGAATLTYTLMVNGSPSSLEVAMSNTAQDGTDLVNTVLLSAGDLISIRVTKSASLSSSPDDIMVSLEVCV